MRKRRKREMTRQRSRRKERIQTKVTREIYVRMEELSRSFDENEVYTNAKQEGKYGIIKHFSIPKIHTERKKLGRTI